MKYTSVKVTDVIHARNEMLLKEKEIYISAVTNLNMNTRALLKNDFGSTLVRNCAKDVAGEVVRRYFDMGDYYITVDQMYDRIVHFSYEQDIDLLSSNEAIRKAFYNIEDSSATSATLHEIQQTCQQAQKKLFVENRQQDSLDRKGKLDYRKSKLTEDGQLHDELTGREGSTTTVIKNEKEVLVSDLHADHVQSRAAATYNERYIKEDHVQKLKEFYNSSDNMQMMHASANTSKGDVRVYDAKGNDITYKATPEQMVEATISRWEADKKDSPDSPKIQKLKEKGYLDDHGNVKLSVREELERNYRHSQNRESVEILKATNYTNVGVDAAKATAASVGKMVAGQVIYYVLPPLIFETQTLLKRKNMTLNIFFDEMKRAGKRVVKYVISKLGAIFKNIFSSSVSKFIKTFFDIIIETVKATVKRLLKVIKQLVMSLVNCIKILVDKKATAAQKMDAITKTLSVTVTAVVLEVLFEYLEKQLGLPDILMEPLQVIVTIMATNVIMLVLQKADLFDVQYGLLVANMERVFDEANASYLQESTALFEEKSTEMKQYMQDLNQHIQEIQESLEQFDLYKDEVTPELQKLNKIFNMEIDFNAEWQNFVTM